MWQSFWRSIDRFSLEHFTYLINELQEIKSLNKQSRDSAVDIVRSIVEIVTYGDRHDSSIFECFMEYQVLAEFLRLLKISRNSGIEVPLLHCLSILIQNLASEHAIYYCFSNEYINNIILHPYKFDNGDLASYYVSFLRTVSGKLNRETICLLVKVQEDVVVSFPLYSEALKFARNEEKMIQIAVRALTLNVYNACDDMVFKFITTPPTSEYFSELVLNLRQQCFNLDSMVSSTMETCTPKMRHQLRMETDQIVNDLYYFNDIIGIGQPILSRLMTQNVLRSLVLPVILPLLELNNNTDPYVSSITSLYIMCRLLQVLDGREVVNSVAFVLLCSYAFSLLRTNKDKDAFSLEAVNYFAEHLTEIEEITIPILEPEEEPTSKTNLFGLLSEYISSTAQFSSCVMDNPAERTRMLSLILSEDHTILLGSVMFLLILSESKDLNSSLSSVLGFADKKIDVKHGVSSDDFLSHAFEGNLFARYVPQILTALLKVLLSQPPLPVLTQWHTGWVLAKLLRNHGMELTGHNYDLFSISYKRSSEELVDELKKCWFDYIPVTLENEWENCKRALEESSRSKDPLIVLDISMQKQTSDGDMPAPHAWQRMVDVVKVFVLHHLLEAFILKGVCHEDSLQKLRSSLVRAPQRDDGTDISATYGTEMDLGPEIACKIAFSRGEYRDVYLIPMAKGISGKLLLAEKLPLRTHQGVVIRIAPLAGLSPKKDDNHSTWLHLRVRSDPRKAGGYNSTVSDQVRDGRWTLAFPTAEICDATLSLILKETDKQRSSVERVVAPFLHCQGQ